MNRRTALLSLFLTVATSSLASGAVAVVVYQFGPGDGTFSLSGSSGSITLASACGLNCTPSDIVAWDWSVVGSIPLSASSTETTLQYAPEAEWLRPWRFNATATGLFLNVADQIGGSGSLTLRADGKSMGWATRARTVVPLQDPIILPAQMTHGAFFFSNPPFVLLQIEPEIIANPTVPVLIARAVPEPSRPWVLAVAGSAVVLASSATKARRMFAPLEFSPTGCSLIAKEERLV